MWHLELTDPITALKFLLWRMCMYSKRYFVSWLSMDTTSCTTSRTSCMVHKTVSLQQTRYVSSLCNGIKLVSVCVMLYLASFCKCLYFCPWCPVHAKAAVTLQLIWQCGLLLQPQWHWRLWHIQSHSRSVWVVDMTSLPEFRFSLLVVTCPTPLLSIQVARKLRYRHPIHIQRRHTEFLLIRSAALLLLMLPVQRLLCRVSCALSVAWVLLFQLHICKAVTKHCHIWSRMM